MKANITRKRNKADREERGRKIQARAKLLMEAKAREKEIQQRRANFRVVGGTDYEGRTA
jgi:hypothetical protein